MQRESWKDRHDHDSAQRHLKACRLGAQRAGRGWRPWILFGIASLFYFYDFLARVAPGVLQSEVKGHNRAITMAFLNFIVKTIRDSY